MLYLASIPSFVDEGNWYGSKSSGGRFGTWAGEELAPNPKVNVPKVFQARIISLHSRTDMCHATEISLYGAFYDRRAV